MDKSYNANFKVQDWELLQRQSLSLDNKEIMSLRRIKQYGIMCNGNIYISFSGGIDSTVLLHLVRRVYPNCEAVFIDTGLEYPEVKDFVKTIKNVTIIRPKMSFKEVLDKYGFPVISKETAEKIYQVRTAKSQKTIDNRLKKSGFGYLPFKWRYLLNAPFKISHMCCNVMKKRPAKKFESESGKSAIVGTMASDSMSRKMSYLRNGCNNFDNGRKMSTPMSFWLENDVWEYIKKYNIKYSKIYDMGYKHTGCMFCMFGIQYDENDRFELMKKYHPNIYKYCMDTLGLKHIIYYVNNCNNPILDFMYKKNNCKSTTNDISLCYKKNRIEW